MTNAFFTPAAVTGRFRAVTGAFAILFTLAGVIFILFYGVPILKTAIESRNWTAADGKIVSSTVMGTGGGSSRPLVEFQYDVSGKTRQSRTLWIGDNVGLPSRERSEGIVRRYPVSQAVTVYYDPTDPERTVLERGVHGTTLFYFYFGGAFLCAGLILWFSRPMLARSFSLPTATLGPTGNS